MSCELKIQNVGSDIVALSVVDFNGKPIVPYLLEKNMNPMV